MIDVEIDVFDAVYSAVAELVPEGSLASEYMPEPPSFPHITLIEIDNDMAVRHQDSRTDECYASIAYEANVYAETREECRTIAAALDEAMTRLGFRPSMRYMPNLSDLSIHRMLGRYEGITDGKHIYHN